MTWLEIVSTIILPVIGYILAEYIGLVKRDVELASALESLKACLTAITEELHELRERVGDVDKKIYHLENL